MPNKPTPQERWQAFRATLPRFTLWQKIGIVGTFLGMHLLFIVFLLPFLLGLGGPPAIDAQKLADPNGAFIEIDGQQMYYVHQAGAGETILLIHGFNESTITWQDTLPALTGYNVYALDLVGFGLSEKGLDANLSHPAQAERIARFMDVHHIEKAHFIAHAMGANVVLHFALAYPDRVDSLILANATLQTASTAAMPEFVLDIPSFKRWARVLLRWIIPATTETQLLSAAEKDEMITSELVQAYDRTLSTKDWDLSLLGMVRDSAFNTLPANFDRLDLPILFLWGAEDGWISPKIGQQFAQDFPDADYVEIEAVGHLPMHESPDEFNRRVLAFLD